MDGNGPGSGAPSAEDGAPLAPAPRRWGTRRLALVALASFSAAILVSIVVVLAQGGATRPPEARSPEELLVLALVSDGTILVGLVIFGRLLLDLRPRDLGFRRPSRSAMRFAAGAGIALWAASIGVNALQIMAFGPHPQSLIVTVGAHTGAFALVLDLLTGAVVAPIAEEALFRGLLFGGLAQRLPAPAAAAVSAFFFAASHGLGVLAPIFVLGLGLAYVYARTGTLWASITTHAFVNAVSLVLLFAAPR